MSGSSIAATAPHASDDGGAAAFSCAPPRRIGATTSTDDGRIMADGGKRNVLMPRFIGVAIILLVDFYIG